MRIVKVTILVMMIGAASIAARQLIHRRTSVDTIKATKPDGQRHKAIEVVSSVQRHETGKYALGDVALLDNGDSWAVGYDGEHIERLYFSNDRGKTWNAEDVPGNGFTMHAITFSDSQHGWAVGGNGLIIRTKDGGQTWELMKSPTRAELHAVHFASPSVGYVGGNNKFRNKMNDEVWGSVEILCTRDGGEIWRKCYQENQPLTVFQITTASEPRAFVSLGDRLIRTDNQGGTWQEVKLSAKYISSVAFAPNGTGWLVGSHGVFQTSSDGGNTWQQPALLTQDFVIRDWEAIAFNGNGIGLAVGENSALALTTDNGKTWQLQTWINSDHLRSVRLQDSRAVVLGAQNAYSIDVSPANTQQLKR
jgi:photosystem II stability/assembly factor-like uncharacterized protein